MIRSAAYQRGYSDATRSTFSNEDRMPLVALTEYRAGFEAGLVARGIAIAKLRATFPIGHQGKTGR